MMMNAFLHRTMSLEMSFPRVPLSIIRMSAFQNVHGGVFGSEQSSICGFHIHSKRSGETERCYLDFNSAGSVTVGPLVGGGTSMGIWLRRVWGDEILSCGVMSRINLRY